MMSPAPILSGPACTGHMCASSLCPPGPCAHSKVTHADSSALLVPTESAQPCCPRAAATPQPYRQSSLDPMRASGQPGQGPGRTEAAPSPGGPPGLPVYETLSIKNILTQKPVSISVSIPGTFPDKPYLVAGALALLVVGGLPIIASHPPAQLVAGCLAMTSFPVVPCTHSSPCSEQGPGGHLFAKDTPRHCGASCRIGIQS